MSKSIDEGHIIMKAMRLCYQGPMVRLPLRYVVTRFLSRGTLDLIISFHLDTIRFVEDYPAWKCPLSDSHALEIEFEKACAVPQVFRAR